MNFYFSDQELQKQKENLDKMLMHMDEIMHVDVDGVKELINPLWEHKEFYE